MGEILPLYVCLRLSLISVGAASAAEEGKFWMCADSVLPEKNIILP